MISDVNVIFFRHGSEVYPAFIVKCPNCKNLNVLFYPFKVFKCEFCKKFYFVDPRVIEITRRVEIKCGSFDDHESYATVKERIRSLL